MHDPKVWKILPLPRHSMSRAQVREIDRRAIELFGLPGVVLMENAGRGAAELFIELGVDGPVVICAGKGNNGGDGFVIARHLENRGSKVSVLLFCDPEELRGDAAVNYRVIAAAKTPLHVFGTEFDANELEGRLAEADWIVDALLGTGTLGDIREPYATIIQRINAADAKVLAIDLPSGMDCDTGLSIGHCVRADHTATFVARKKGFNTDESRELTGTVHVIDIGVPRVMLDG